MVLLGQVEPLRIDLDEMERGLSSPESAEQVPAIAPRSGDELAGMDLFATYAGRAPTWGWLQSGDQS